MMLLYSFGLVMAVVVSAPMWGWRMLRQGRYREGLRERLGAVPERLMVATRGRRVVWVHAVSVGEVIAATRLVAALEEALPGYLVVVSTTTPTGQRVARERFGVDRVFFYPLDFAFAVRAFAKALQPRLVILMESELWPGALVEWSRMSVPVAVVNARVSDRSLPRYMALRALWGPLLRRVSLLLAQSGEDAARWVRIGAAAERVRSVGNLKFDVQPVEETPLARLVRQQLPEGCAVLVCGSTHEGEEALLLDCWRGFSLAAGRVMLLAPRHPERAAEVEALAVERGLGVVRLSEWRLAAGAIAPGSVLLVDTVGELASLYALARVAFVGGSLVPRGGQNPLEAVRFGVPVVMGPHVENFRTIVAGLKESGSLEVVDADALCGTLDRLLMTAGLPEDVRQRSREFFEEQSGATARTVAGLLALLEERAR